MPPANSPAGYRACNCRHHSPCRQLAAPYRAADRRHRTRPPPETAKGRKAKDAHRRPQKPAPHAGAPPVGGAGMPPADRPAVGKGVHWRPLRHPVGDAATPPPQACEVCERRVCERRVCECASAGGTLQKRSSPGVPYRACGTLRVLRPLRSGRRDSGGRPLSSPWNPGSGPSAYDTYTAAPQACR